MSILYILIIILVLVFFALACFQKSKKPRQQVRYAIFLEWGSKTADFKNGSIPERLIQKGLRVPNNYSYDG